MTAVQDILRSLGITRCYKGFKHTEYAICLAIQDLSLIHIFEVRLQQSADYRRGAADRKDLYHPLRRAAVL